MLAFRDHPTIAEALELKKQVAEAEKRKAGQSKAMRKLSEEREAQAEKERVQQQTLSKLLADRERRADTELKMKEEMEKLAEEKKAREKEERDIMQVWCAIVAAIDCTGILALAGMAAGVTG